MTTCKHDNHTHTVHCGHHAIKHNDHVDFLHNGHLHTADGAEHTLALKEVTDHHQHNCEKQHPHNNACGCEQIQHADHVDYLVGNHLHHIHDGHCDYHGAIEFA